MLYLAARPDRLCSIAEIAGAYGISQKHLMVVSDLVSAGYLVSERGRGRSGGVRLACAQTAISIGAVVRHRRRCHGC